MGGRPALAAAAITLAVALNGACSKSSPTTPTNPAPVPTRLAITATVPQQLTLPEGTTETEVGADTNIDALCKGGRANGDYEILTDTLSSSPTRVHRTMLRNLQPGNTPYYFACITPERSSTANGQVNIQIPLPAVLARGAVVDLHSGRPVSGTLNINGKSFEIDPAGRYEIGRSSELSVGQRYNGTITPSSGGYYTRNFVGTLTPGGFEVDLGGGRKDTLNVYRESATFSLAEYIAFCFKRDNYLTRIETPIKFAIFDTKTYRISGGGSYVEVATQNMRQDSKDNLLQILRQDAPFWTDNQIYTPANIDSFIKLQSRGDELPDISRRGPYWAGWFIILANVDLDPSRFLIQISDNGYENQGRITAGIMEFQPNMTVEQINWRRDLREILGYKEIRDTLRDERAPYAAVMFRRPVGHTAPDTSRQ